MKEMEKNGKERGSRIQGEDLSSLPILYHLQVEIQSGFDSWVISLVVDAFDLGVGLLLLVVGLEEVE